MQRYRKPVLSMILGLICACPLLVACGTIQVGVEHTSTPQVTAVPMATEVIPAATQAQETPTSQSSPTQVATASGTDIPIGTSEWIKYTNLPLNVELHYPAHWQAARGEEGRYDGEDGFFAVDAIDAPQATIDHVVADQIGHKLRPYGSRPVIETLQIQGCEARLILPSGDADDAAHAVLIARYPKPVQLGAPCQFLALYADQGHIRAIVRTVRFVGTSSVAPRPTTVPGHQPPPAIVPVGQPPGLVYRLEDAVWLVDAHGRSVYVSDDSRVFVSPDGSQLIRYNPDDQEYWLTDRVTGAEWNLTRTPRRRECCFRWWPARPGTVLFHSIDPAGGPSGISPAPMGFLTAVNVDGTEYRILDPEHDVGLVAIAPSPDGQTIAYGWGHTVWLYNWDSGAEVFDPFEYGLTEGSNLYLGSPAWSPDSAKLAWVISGKLGDGIRGGMALVVFDLAERTARLLHPYYPTRKGLWPGAPVWRPDGRWLAFEAWAQDADQDGVWVVQVDGEQEHYLGQGYHPVWSPDGLKLAFNRTARDIAIGIDVADVDVWEPYPLDCLTSAWLKGWVDVVSVSTSTVAPKRMSSVAP